MDHIIPKTTFKGRELLDQSKLHFKADQLIKETYGKMNSQFKGCSIGCHMHHIDKDFKGQENEIDGGIHKAVASHYGYPEWIAYLQDWIFENLPEGENRKWHVELAQALHDAPQPIDWQTLLHLTHIEIQRISYAVAGKSKDVVQSVIDLHQRAVDGDAPSAEEWLAAKSATWSAERSAQRSSAELAEWLAAWSAAESVEWSEPRSAARSADRIAAGSSEVVQEIRDAFLMSIRSQVPA